MINENKMIDANMGRDMLVTFAQGKHIRCDGGGNPCSNVAAVRVKDWDDNYFEWGHALFFCFTHATEHGVVMV